MNAISTYLKSVERDIQKGISTEHTYRPALEALVESMADGVEATNEPKRIACGAPDFIVTRGQTPLGYIEAKDVGKPLDAIETDARRKQPKTHDGEQLKRYLESLGNLILTDYLEFRWYVAAEHRLTVRVAKVGKQEKLRKLKEGAEQLTQLLTSFLTCQVPTVGSPKELAARMSALARVIRDTISRAFEDEDKGGSLHEQMEGFRKVLLHDLTEAQFADMYAQTICYGLFAARCNTTGEFTRQHAAYDLPKTNPFLRTMFGHIAGPELDDRIAWAVDDLAGLLNRADMDSILRDFGKRTRREDPVVHFYETFLAAYDPKMREARGVYYTPEPVVSYIVRSVDHILREDFGFEDGLADTSVIKTNGQDAHATVHRVLVLDPACGTGTFLHGVIDQIHEHMLDRGQGGAWSSYVSEHLLPRLFGFELLVAPYTVAHMKLALQLDESGYDFMSGERLRVYLTNTLEEALDVVGLPIFAEWLAKEANAAGAVKQDAPVMVVLGNPPYSGHSANVGKWIVELLHGHDSQTGKGTANYFEVDGKPLGEKNPKWLNDDYVKFIRFAQWRIERTGYGILAFITNHSYLDNPTFRGMRQSLVESFDDIYVLDLHGNAKKKERCPDGSKDENVFDIQQGVAISIFVKKRGTGGPPVEVHGQDGHATVRHAEVWGVRDVSAKDGSGKYAWLRQKDLASTEWRSLQPRPPFYLFVPQAVELLAEYEQGWRVTDIFPVNGVGMTTARDHVVIDFDMDPILERARVFRDSRDPDEELCRQLGIPVKKGWDIAKARRLIRAEEDLGRHIKPVLYRPFDQRVIFYHDSLVWRTVKRVMQHMLAGRNVALTLGRASQVIGATEWDIVFCTKAITEFNLYRRGGNVLCPLYLYAIDTAEQDTRARSANLALEFVGELARKLNLKFIADGSAAVPAALRDEPDGAMAEPRGPFGPEDVFDYMYAVFHSPTYRSRYAEFLKIDFPRLPLTSNADLFRELCASGEELVGLHLMEKHGPAMTTYPVDGDNVVEKVRYTQPSPQPSPARGRGSAGGKGSASGRGCPEGTGEGGRVWINKTQYFEGVPPQVWEFHIGGYQVCRKWLKDRKGRQLTYDDTTHYQHIVSALAETIRIMAEIDETIDRHGGWPVK